MAVSPTTEQWESVLDITGQMRTNSSFDPVAKAHRKFALFYGMDILSLVIALVGLVGNSIVLWILGFHIQRSPFSVYILNLAGSDALFLGSCFVLCMGEIVGYFHSLVLVVGRWILNLFYCVGLSLLVVISTERCLSVLFPIWYRCHRPKHTSATVCAILWALPGLFWVIFVVLRFLENLHVYVLYNTLPFMEIGWFSLLTCMLCVSSLTLVLRVQCSSQHRQPPRLYLLILLAVLLFLLFELPLGIIDAIWLFHRYPLVPHGLPRLLACVNSSANPFIYFFLGSQWRKRGREALRVVLQRALGEEQVEGFGERDTSHPNTLDKLS
ncbi:mas-related G-protein coupled receptor member X2-like [Gracilinanus agilis]|uniref:mas-related G-protein coupled receptor member X2-like n=1 Tax=Gracilinanus agilis TaxID=191870 RepID=UPI001CFD8D00|nr:mas-related G-protein coupled receptor member X2-like [Gracilinanus agilis]